MPLAIAHSMALLVFRTDGVFDAMLGSERELREKSGDSADADEAAQAFRDDVARCSEMKPPGSRTSLADDL